MIDKNNKNILGSGNRLIKKPCTVDDLNSLASQLELENRLKPNGVMSNRTSVKKSSTFNVVDCLNVPFEITTFFDTYASGVDFIRSIPFDSGYVQRTFDTPGGLQIYRPLTVLESLEVMVNDYNRLTDVNGRDRTLDDRKRLLSNYKFTCTGIAYKAGGGEFKIIPNCNELLTMSSDNTDAFLTNFYDTLNGIKLQISKANNANNYNCALTQLAVNNHEGWIALVEETDHGRKVLSEYSNIVFKLLKDRNKTIGMNFNIRQNPTTDELRALIVRDVDFNSGASGNYYLNNGARFLLVAPLQKNLINQ